MLTAVRLVIDALGPLSKRRQDKVTFAFFWISSRLSDQVGVEPTEAGKMLPLAPRGSETLFIRDLAALKEWDAMRGSL